VDLYTPNPSTTSDNVEVSAHGPATAPITAPMSKPGLKMMLFAERIDRVQHGLSGSPCIDLGKKD
jgi:hypothetical protein